jgi:hypothetical protein
MHWAKRRFLRIVHLSEANLFRLNSANLFAAPTIVQSKLSTESTLGFPYRRTLFCITLYDVLNMLYIFWMSYYCLSNIFDKCRWWILLHYILSSILIERFCQKYSVCNPWIIIPCSVFQLYLCDPMISLDVRISLAT